jgi:phytoene dehydrogenase-like protein
VSASRTALDPSRCPEGKSILWLQIPDAPRHVKGDAGGRNRDRAAQWTEATREAFADRIEAILREPYRRFRQDRSPARPIRRRIWKA